MMLRAAYEATGDAKYLTLQRKAFDWFLGENDIHAPVYDFRTKGAADGLERSGLNLNQGAESMVSFLLSLLCIVESYAAGTHISEQKKTSEDNLIAPINLTIPDIRADWEASEPVAPEIG